MHTDVRLYSVAGSLSCTSRKATSVKKEESSKAKRNRRPISLDSGKEMMCTYWGCPILFMWRVIGRFYLHRNHDNIFFKFFFNFIGLTALLTGQKVWKYEFGMIIFKFFWFYLSSKCDHLEFHVNVKKFWILIFP